VLRAEPFEFEGTPDTVNIEYVWFEDLGGDSRLRGRSSRTLRAIRLLVALGHATFHDGDRSASRASSSLRPLPARTRSAVVANTAAGAVD